MPVNSLQVYVFISVGKPLSLLSKLEKGGIIKLDKLDTLKKEADIKTLKTYILTINSC